RAEQQVEGEPHIAHHVIPHSGYGHASVFIAFGVLLLEAQRDGRKLSLRLFQGDVWLQAADRKETQAGAGQSSVDSIRRTPDVTLIRKVKSRREDTHDGQLLIGDPNPLPQNGIASAEMSLPI